MLPPPKIIVRNGYTVVDDSEVGSKYRYLEPEISETNLKHIFAVATGWGASEKLLTKICHEQGKQLHLFYPIIPGGTSSIAKRRARESGVIIEDIPSYDPREVKAVASQNAHKNNGKLISLSNNALIRAYAETAQKLDLDPHLVVTASSTGTLCSALQIPWNKSAHETVVVLDLDNANMGRAKVIKSLQELSEPSKTIPPFRCNLNFEGKAWEYLVNTHEPNENIVFWNSAGPN